MKTGAEAAIRALYRDYGRAVYAVAYRVLGRADLAEDATQQVFVRAWPAAGFGAARDLGPWLRAVARDVAIDISRRESRRSVRKHAARVEVIPSDALDAAWHVRRAIDSLSAEEAAIVRLQHLERLTQGEIAHALDLPLGTVASRSRGAHHRLASAWDDRRVKSVGGAVPAAGELSATAPCI